jgi:hypothetical protein
MTFQDLSQQVMALPIADNSSNHFWRQSSRKLKWATEPLQPSRSSDHSTLGPKVSSV